MDRSTRLREIKYSVCGVYSPEPRAEVYCLQLNFKLSKFAYSVIEFSYKSRRSVELYFTTVYWDDENSHSSKKSLRVQLSILRTAFRVLRDCALFTARVTGF